MFCEKCGNLLPENVKFCPNCGNCVIRPTDSETKSEEAHIEAQTVKTEDNNSGMYQTENIRPHEQTNDHAQTHTDAPASSLAIRKTASSGMFLLASILFTATLFFSFTSAFSDFDAVEYLLNVIGRVSPELADQIMPYFEYPYYTYNILGAGMYLRGIIALIPSVIYCIALWCIYAASKRNGERMGTGGLTTVKVMLIIRLVALIISLLAILLFGGVLMLINLDEPQLVLALRVIIVGLLTAAVIGFGIKILVTSLEISAVSGAKAAALGKSEKKAPLFLAILFFISAVCIFISALISPNFAGNILRAVWICFERIVSAVTTFVFGLVIVKSRSDMKNARNIQN